MLVAVLNISADDEGLTEDGENVDSGTCLTKLLLAFPTTQFHSLLSQLGAHASFTAFEHTGMFSSGSSSVQTACGSYAVEEMSNLVKVRFCKFMGAPRGHC